MKLKSTVIKNYRGIKEETLVSFQDFNCIVGKNDVGKSTLLKAIDAFLNENLVNSYQIYRHDHLSDRFLDSAKRG